MHHPLDLAILAFPGPKSRYTNVRDTSQGPNACKRLTKVEFRVFGDREEQGTSGGGNEWNGGCEDEDSYETRSESVESVQSGLVDEYSRNDDGDGAKSIS